MGNNLDEVLDTTLELMLIVLGMVVDIASVVSRERQDTADPLLLVGETLGAPGTGGGEERIRAALRALADDHDLDKYREALGLPKGRRAASQIPDVPVSEVSRIEEPQ